jgi:hypothetical protein
MPRAQATVRPPTPSGAHPSTSRACLKCVRSARAIGPEARLARASPGLPQETSASADGSTSQIPKFIPWLGRIDSVRRPLHTGSVTARLTSRSRQCSAKHGTFGHGAGFEQRLIVYASQKPPRLSRLSHMQPAHVPGSSTIILTTRFLLRRSCPGTSRNWLSMAAPERANLRPLTAPWRHSDARNHRHCTRRTERPRPR